MSIDFLSPHFYSLFPHLSFYFHRYFIHPHPIALVAQDLHSPSQQIPAVAHANTEVISTPAVPPTLSDRPQPATTNTHGRSQARRPTVEISLRLFCGFYP